MGHPMATLLLLLLLPNTDAVTPQSPVLGDTSLPHGPSTAPCHCDTVGSALTACAGSPECLCSTAHGTVNVSDFHAQECQGSARTVAAAVGGTAAVAVVVVVAMVVARWCRGTAAAAGWGKQDPPAAQGQPRYISRDAESGPAAAATTDACLAPDYENVFIGSCVAPSAAPARDGAMGWQQKGYSPQVPEDDAYFLESDGDQPIYANTGTPGEDVYVIPDK